MSSVGGRVISAREVSQGCAGEKFRTEDQRMVLRSGEVLTKARVDAPWTPSTRKEGAG